MQWIVGHKPKLCFIVIYIKYQSAIDFLQWNVKSTSKLNYEGFSTPMGPNGPRFKLIYHDGMVYEVWIGFKFTIAHKGILVNIQGCIGDSKQDLQVEIID